MDGLDAIDRETLPTRTLIVSALDDSPSSSKAPEAGAPGYIFKVTRGVDIEDSILAVARGEVRISAHLLVRLLRGILGRRRARQALHTHASSTSYVSPPTDPNPAMPTSSA